MLWRRGTFLVPMGQAVLVAAVLSGTLAGAQTFRGAINGTVTDPAGAAIPGAQVQIADDATGIVRQTVSAAGGDFNFPDLPLGSYTVTVTTSGFDTLKVIKVTVSAGAIHTVPVNSLSPSKPRRLKSAAPAWRSTPRRRYRQPRSQARQCRTFR
jgi:hypothetical protein